MNALASTLAHLLVSQLVSKMNMIKFDHQLHSVDQYDNFYISPDRTRQERESFRKLQAELKQRNYGCKPNLI